MAGLALLCLAPAAQAVTYSFNNQTLATFTARIQYYTFTNVLVNFGLLTVPPGQNTFTLPANCDRIFGVRVYAPAGCGGQSTFFKCAQTHPPPMFPQVLAACDTCISIPDTLGNVQYVAHDGPYWINTMACPALNPGGPGPFKICTDHSTVNQVLDYGPCCNNKGCRISGAVPPSCDCP
ncbi:MAG: hypothetical protein IPJ76_01825 [Flavobacteriales bacterium]|nr:MAG: hypothetical protein IPJ76_01825 [Flavobacteriales bacterium]